MRVHGESVGSGLAKTTDVDAGAAVLRAIDRVAVPIAPPPTENASVVRAFDTRGVTMVVLEIE